MYRHIILFTLMLAAVCSCTESGTPHRPSCTDITVLPATPAYEQSGSTLSWIYAMVETLEADRLSMGDSITLSPLWVMRHAIAERARICYNSGADIVTGGTLADAWDIICRHGIVTQSSYCLRPISQQGMNAAYSTAARAAEHAALIARKQSSGSKGLRAKYREPGTEGRELDRQDQSIMEQRIESVLDKTLGPPPLNVFLYGMDYTPKQLAESVALPGEWKAYTSFCHLPYYQDVRLSMYPDASLYAAHNLPLDSLLALVDRSLRNGHPVAWEGDMKKGHAAASLSEGQQQDSAAVIKEYAEQRKRLYRSNRLKPSQQHCILGLARHNGSGEKHYILKAYADGPARQTSKTATPQHTRKYSTAYMPLSTLLTATTVVMVKNRGEK